LVIAGPQPGDEVVATGWAGTRAARFRPANEKLYQPARLLDETRIP